ncbi:CMRF35-like molecule 9 [Dugong dugon]
MWLLLLWGCLLLPGSTALEGPKEISGFEGDTVSVRCSYGEKLKRNQKYWCRMSGIFISRCSGTIYAGEDGQEVASDRVSIRDSLQEQAFTVTLRNLTLGDDGKYWCGVTRLGFDETLLVTLVVFPGPCCPPSTPPPFQPLATRSFQPKAKAQQTQPPELSERMNGSSVPPPPLFQETPTTSPHAVTSPHSETSPHAGSSLLATQLDSTSAKGTSPIPSSSSSKSRVSIPMVRMLAPVLVLLALLLATGLAGLGSHVLRWKKEAHLAMETEKNQKKVHLPHLTSEEEEASSQNLKGDSIPVPPHHLSGHKLFHSEFLPV